MLRMLLRMLGVACLLLLTGLAHADERILSFHSDIQINADRSMIVTETIEVRAEGIRIRHGIYRDFPTRYTDQYGNEYHVGFKVLSVERDGQPDSYHQKELENGVRTYIGKKNYYLPHGVYTYTLRYRTTRQLGFFKKFDELYWNVTGNGWDFAIDRSRARVHLPVKSAGSDLRLSAYTGYKGDKGQDYKDDVTNEGDVYFETTRPLLPHEGLTIAVGWPKGIIRAPTAAEVRTQFIQDNQTGLICLGILLVLFVYYFLIWSKVGRDPVRGTIIPLYTPPKGYSPASMRYINRMGYDNKTFSTAIINLAVKGFLRIKQIGKEYRLIRIDPRPKLELAAGEKVLLAKLFKSGSHVNLGSSTTSIERDALNTAKGKHKKSLNRNYHKLYFRTNSEWIVIGVLLTLLIAISLLITARTKDSAFITIWTIFWSFGVLVLTFQVVRAWSGVWKTGNGVIAAFLISLFALPFWGGELFGLYQLSRHYSLWAIACLLIAIFLNVGFYYWLKAPTLAGRKLLDRLEGFRDYLEMAEKDEMNLRNPPDKVPALFEVYLPFAMALDVEQQWAEKFTAVFAQLESRGQPYTPTWYNGPYLPLGNFDTFTNGFSSSVSSAAAPPGSSSGSGGGGSSGGGGGGGGGGGW